jgi:hypothetical protein
MGDEIKLKYEEDWEETNRRRVQAGQREVLND